MSDLCRKRIINAVGKLGKKDDGRYREEILKMVESLSGLGQVRRFRRACSLLSVLARELLNATY